MGLLGNFIEGKKETSPAALQKINVHDLVPHEDNFYLLSDIDMLEGAIEMQGGVKESLIVTPIEGGKYKVISGHRRRQATLNLLEKGAAVSEELPCKVETYESREEEQAAIILANSATRKLTAAEEIEQYKRMKPICTKYCKDNKISGRVRDYAAKLLKTTGSNIAKLDAIDSNLIPEYKKKMKEGKLNKTVAYELASLPKDKQKAVFKDKKEDVITEDIKKVKCSGMSLRIDCVSLEQSAIVAEFLDGQKIKYKVVP